MCTKNHHEWKIKGVKRQRWESTACCTFNTYVCYVCIAKEQSDIDMYMTWLDLLRHLWAGCVCCRREGWLRCLCVCVFLCVCEDRGRFVESLCGWPGYIYHCTVIFLQWMDQPDFLISDSVHHHHAAVELTYSIVPRDFGQTRRCPSCPWPNRFPSTVNITSCEPDNIPLLLLALASTELYWYFFGQATRMYYNSLCAEYNTVYLSMGGTKLDQPWAMDGWNQTSLVRAASTELRCEGERVWFLLLSLPANKARWQYSIPSELALGACLPALSSLDLSGKWIYFWDATPRSSGKLTNPLVSLSLDKKIT